MSDLDEKLEEIYNGVGESFYWEGTLGEDDCEERRADFVKSVNKALTDAGYINLSDRGGLIHTTVVDSRGRTEYMTGQEWYDRFTKEVGMWGTGAYSRDLDSVLDAAKKAAGLK